MERNWNKTANNTKENRPCITQRQGKSLEQTKKKGEEDKKEHEWESKHTHEGKDNKSDTK